MRRRSAKPGPDQPSFDGLAKPSRRRAELAAGRDLRELRRTDALVPNAAALAVLYQRLAAHVDRADQAGESYTVGYLARQLRETHAYLTGREAPPSELDPFALSAPVVDETFA